MARQPTGNPPGRPRREFDQKLFQDLCHIQCTNSEIESVLHSEIRIIDGWCLRTYGECFNDCYKRFSEGGKSSLRRHQFHLAQRNTSMAIWLGKIWLGQKDPVEEINSKRVIGALERINELRIVAENGNANIGNQSEKST